MGRTSGAAVTAQEPPELSTTIEQTTNPWKKENKENYANALRVALQGTPYHTCTTWLLVWAYACTGKQGFHICEVFVRGIQR